VRVARSYLLCGRDFLVSYAEKHLIAGETVQYETKLHWIVMLGHLVVALALAAAGVALLVWPVTSSRTELARYTAEMGWGSLALFVLAAIVFFIGVVRRGATEMAVTNRRVIVKTGLANRRTLELLLARIESVVVEEPAMGRVLGYGTVIVRGTGGTPEVFPQIAHPLQFREQVQRQIAGEGKG
jgi:uncharacterized membrane protein YdbT with pleckstrin-like domain